MTKEEFNIPIAGLKDKVYHYEYELDSSFFDAVEKPLIREPAIELSLVLDKTNEPYVVDVTISGTSAGECDRCGGQIRIPIEGRYRLFVEFGEPGAETEDDTEVIYISRDDHELRLFEHLYDFVNLSYPLVKRCTKTKDLEQCDRLFERYMKQEDAADDDREDPRWAALKKLK